MKTLALLSFMTLTACGVTPSLSESKVAAPAAGLHSLYSFMVDAREVDGNYQKLSIRLEEGDTYVATMHTITAGEGFPVSNTTEEIASQLECTVSKDTKGKLAELFCMHDNRPADGYLVELTVKRNESKRYDVIVHRNAYPQIAGTRGFDEIVELAYEMIRQN